MGYSPRGHKESDTVERLSTVHAWCCPQAGVPLREGARVDGRFGNMGFYLTWTREGRSCLACCLVSGDNVEPALE